MGWRENVLSAAPQYLEPGEQIKAVALAQIGPSPWLTAMFGVLLAGLMKSRVIVVTDRAVVLLDSSPWTPSKPRGAVGRFPLQSFDGLTGMWGKTTIGDQKLWVHKRFQKELKAA